MKKTYLTILFASVLILSCERPKDTSMSFHNADAIAPVPSISAGKWNKMKGEISIDTLHLYKGKNTLRLASSELDERKGIYSWHAFDLTEVDGKILTIKGKYKIEKAKDTKVIFKIQQYFHTENVDSIIVESAGSSRWKDFSIHATMDEESEWAALYIIGEGDIDIRLADCEAWIDKTPVSDIVNRQFAAKMDKEFDNGSNINLENLTPQMIENLEVLGKVWGFLKYYHPEVTQGKYNWDYELFRVLPSIASAKDKNRRNRLLNKWIDEYGKIKGTSDYTISDSTKYSRFIDLDWLVDENMLGSQLTSKLQKVNAGKRSKKFNHYISSHASNNRQVFFERENPYKNIRWDDQGFRILTLFRIWNAIEYCFPYTHYTDTEWKTLLKDFLPKFVSSKDQTSYELAIKELCSKIDDSHGYVHIPNHKLHDTVLAPFYRRNSVPVILILSAEGYVVVKYSNSEFFHRGDIIDSIDGKDVDSIIEEMAPYVIASNRSGLIRNIIPYIMSSQSDEMNVGVIRDGKKLMIHVDHFRRNKQPRSMKSWREYGLNDRDIIHVDNIKSAGENRDIVQNNMNSKGLIMDMRLYPDNDNTKFLPPLILSKYPLWISTNDKSRPGNYQVKFGYDKINEPEKKPNYQGKIVILVDENTQSAGESTAMQHRLAPNSLIIGRQTAGADGAVYRIPIPGGGFFKYTWNGAYYPNWEILQRKGVKIDIPVSPTVNDIKEGRDVWIEKAIEIIENE